MSHTAKQAVKLVLPSCSYQPSIWQKIATIAIKKAAATVQSQLDVESVDEDDYDNKLGLEPPLVIKPEGSVLFEARAAVAFLTGASAEQIREESPELSKCIRSIKSSGLVYQAKYK